MTITLYTIRDEISDHHASPFGAPNDATAMRYFQDLLHDEDTAYGRHPADFNLYRTGTFNLDTGVLTALEKIVLVSTRPEDLN